MDGSVQYIYRYRYIYGVSWDHWRITSGTTMQEASKKPLISYGRVSLGHMKVTTRAILCNDTLL